MSLAPNCLRCGALLSSGIPELRCPRCLMEAGLVNSEATVLTGEAKQKTSRGGFEEATIAELNAALPQFEFVELLGMGGMGQGLSS